MSKQTKSTPAVETIAVPIARMHGYVETLVDRSLVRLVNGRKPINMTGLADAVVADIKAHCGVDLTAKRVAGDLEYLAYRKRLTTKAGKLAGSEPRNGRSDAATAAAALDDNAGRKPSKRATRVVKQAAAKAKRAAKQAPIADDATDNG